MKHIIAFLTILFMAFAAHAQTLTQAEKSFDEGDFATAQKQYQELLSTAKGDELYQVQLRLANCQYSQGKYLEAVKTLLSYPLPTSVLWKARFLLYRTQMAMQASGMYAAILEERAIENNQDPQFWTKDQWNAHIQNDFEQLWSLRQELINAPIAQETLIIQTKNTDTKRIPTLFDFATQQWLEWLTYPRVKLPSPTPRSYLAGTATPVKEFQAVSAKVADILQTAYTLQGKDRQDARLFWQTDFILLPFNQQNWFEISNKQKALKTATEQLNTIIGSPTPATTWQKIKSRFTSTQAPYGQSYAAYRAAQLLWENDERAQALDICRRATSSLATSYYTEQCKQLQNRITEPEISFSELPHALNPMQPKVNLYVRNIPQVYIRIYPVTQEELKQLHQDSSRSYRTEWRNLVDNISEEKIQRLLSFDTQKYQLAHKQITYKKPYFPETPAITLPALTKGFYIVLASENEKFDYSLGKIVGTVINITDVALFVTTGINDNAEKYVRTLTSSGNTFTPELFRIYTLDLKTGQPLPNTSLKIAKDRENSHQQAKTNQEGTYAISFPIQVANNYAKNSHNIDVWAEHPQNGVTFTPHNTYFHFSPNTPVRLFAQTDRAIYRPGQKVFISVQGFQTTPRGMQVLPKNSVDVTVTSNQNSKKIFQTSLTLNEFGTAQTQFTLPQGDQIMLGSFSVNVTARANTEKYFAHHSFSVEEYKRPEYEITLEDPKQPLAYHQTGTVTGKAMYYTGTPLQKATVKYTISQREYIPPFYWWLRWIATPEEQIAQGQTITNDKGEFSISWKPEAKRKEETATQYTLRAEVYDETGRAIDTSRTYKVSTYPRLFKIDFTQGFYDANKQAPLADITLTNADGQAITGSVIARVSRVQDTPKIEKDAPSLEQWYQDAKDATVVFTNTLTFNTPVAQTLQLPALPEGIYRLTLKAKEAQDQSVLFVVAAPQCALKLPDVTLAQYSTYQPGETARILLGSSTLTGSKWVETYRKGEFLAASSRLPGGISIYEYLVTQQDRGGLGIRWFGASDYTFHNGSVSCAVPFDNQKLTLQPAITQTNKPGQAVSWKLTVKDAKNAPINGQASVSVYDKSLDYYSKLQLPFALSSLFNQYTHMPELVVSYLSQNGIYLDKVYKTNQWTPAPQLPLLNLIMPHHYYANFAEATKAIAPRMMKLAARGVATADFEMAATYEEDTMDEMSMSNQVLDMKTVQTSAQKEIETKDSIRTDFAETAYFNSLLPVKNGTARLNFTLPQSVTTWNVLGFALTKDAQLGDFAATSITRKDFMVRLHLPRFYREKDNGILQASVMNLTNRKITVPVTIAITQNKQNKAKAFGITMLTKNVSVPPNATEYVQWEIDVPTAPGLYEVTASAHSATDTDGEQRTLPVFPSLSRLLASAHTALKDGTNTLTVTELNDVTDAKPELAALTVNPSLALSVLNSLPNLLSTPYKDLISSLNRYVPLAIVNQFYTTYPQLKEAVHKLPKRTGTTATWNEKDPLRLTMLEQTPWLQTALGQPEKNANLISLFDATTVSKRLEQERANILKFQNANGSFSWFVGGKDDPYLTLHVLDAFSQAVGFGVNVPEKQAQKAISYIIPKIEGQLKEDKTGSVGTVSYALYAAYTLSAFPANWTQMASAKPYIKKWVDYADKQTRFMTPLGQIYAAAVYHRLGDDIKATQYLNKVLARMQNNPLTGAYFAPEPQSWVWYQDTITTQTVTLKTLLEMRPQSDKIDPMVQWLLFNRQVTSWQNPNAAAKAVFALLDVMHSKGALSSPTSYQISWAGTQAKRSFEPFDWTEDLQWTKQGAQLTPATYQAQVIKQGQMTDFASLNVIYTSAEAKASPKGVLNVTREYFVRFTQDGVQKLRPVKEGDAFKVGDEVEVHLTLTADSAFEYVQLTDPKPAGFENKELLSGWTWKPVSMYQEVRDADTNFFIDRLPAGQVKLHYVLRPTVPGKFHAKPAQIQSMYAPEYGAHSAAETVQVNK